MKCHLVMVLLLVGTLLAAGEPSVPPPAPLTVAVAEFQNRHPLGDQEWIATALPELIGSALSSATREGGRGIVVVDRTAIAALEGEQRLAGERAQGQGAVASHVIGGSFTVTDNQVQLDIAVTPVGQAATWTQHLSGPPEQLASLARRAALGALASLGNPGSSPAKQNAADDLPLTALVIFHRGREAQRRGDHAWALADLLRTCKLAPQFGEAWLSLGVTLEALGRPQAALRAWEQAITCDPDDPGMAAALFRLARAREAQPALSRRLYERLIEDYPFTPAPPEVVARPMQPGEIVTFAEIAAARSARLIDQAPSAPLIAQGGSPASATSTSAGSALVEAGLRQWRRQLDLSAKDENRDPNDVIYVRQGLLNAAGGWPEGAPCVRLIDGKPVTVPLVHQGVAIGPPPGQVIERLTAVAVSRAAGSAELFRFDLQAFSLRRTNTSGESVVASKDGQPVTVTVSPWHATGFFATAWPQPLVRTPGSSGSQPRAEVVLTATLRPARPGTLWVTTQPPGALITIDGAPRGVSPCRIIDLAPGPVRVQADTYLGHNPDGQIEPILKHLRFTGDQTVQVAGEGETRIDWTLGHTPDRPSAHWSSLRLALPAPLGVEIPRVNAAPRYNVLAAHPAVIRHPRTGWLLAWNEDGDVRLAASRDGKTWAAQRSTPFNSGAAEKLMALAVSPTGQVLLTFQREQEVLGVTSDDFSTWGAATRITQDVSAGDIAPVLGAVAAKDGQWVVAYKNNYGHLYLARSELGRTWTVTATRAMVATDGWWSGERQLLVSTNDGVPALLSVATSSQKPNPKTCRLVRAVLGPDNQWIEHDHSQDFPQDRTYDDPRLHVIGPSAYELFNRKGLNVRWTAGGEVELFDGPRVDADEVAVSREQDGFLLLLRAGSWWLAEKQGTQAVVIAQAPMISYEKPTAVSTGTAPASVVSVTAAEAIVPATSPASALPASPDPHPSERPQTSEPVAESAPLKRKHGTFTMVLVFGGVLAATGAITWWWWGFLRRRRLEQQS